MSLQDLIILNEKCEEYEKEISNLQEQLKEREEMIRKLLVHVPYRRDLASDQEPNNLILEASKATKGEECLKQDM